jgi:PAS domain S-box-containing protein
VLPEALPRAFVVAIFSNSKAPTSLRDRTLERTIGVTLILGIVVGIALIAADRFEYQRLSETARWSAHTSDVLYLIEGVSASLAEAEANERAYLLTSDATFLQRYRSIVTTWTRSVAELTVLTADNPYQQANCAKLKELVDLRRNALDRTITIHDANGIAAVTQLINDPERARVTNDLRQVAADMTAYERTLLDQHLAAERHAQEATLAVEAIAVALLFMTLLGSYVWIRRELRARMASQEILELLPDAVFTVTGMADGGRISYMNAQACRMFGYEHSELVNQSIDVLVPPSVREHHAQHRRVYARSPTLRTMGASLDLLGRRRDGAEFPIDVLLKPRDNSAASATIAIVRDMTTVHATRAAHEKQLQTLIDNVPIAIAYVDKAERLQLANEEFRKIALYRGDPRGMPVRSVIGDAVYEATEDSRRRALAGERVSMVMPVTVHGQQRIHEMTQIPDRDSTGTVKGAYGFGYDITEREQLSVELRRSEERTRELFTQASEGIFIVDREGRYIDVNRAGCALLGCTREEIVRQSFVDLLAPEDLERWGQGMTVLLAGGAILGDWKLRHKDGHFVPVQLSGTLLPDGRLLGFVRDITEREHLEDALTQARDSAVQANEVKSRFLAAASHDLRQPLQTIWSLQAVLARAFKDTDYAPQLALLEEAVRNMDQMLSALVDINRLEKGAIHPVIRDFSLQEVLPKLRSEFGYAAAAKSLTLDIEESTEFARSDPMLLPVILRNLLGNAIKYTQHGAIQLRVRTDGSQLFIDIVDSGPGVPPEHLQRLFDAFYQVDNPNHDQRQGVGLGLSIVQTICRLLGHEVTIETRLGEGSTFTVQIARGVTTDLPHEPLANTATIAAAPSSGAKILHIEDDPGISRSMAMLLSLEGYDVIGAASRDEVLEHVKVRGLRPDLILSDFQLPMGFTGPEIVAEIATMLGVKTPTIMLTGDIAVSHVAQAKLIVDRIMPKPVDINLLLREIDNLLTTQH